MVNFFKKIFNQKIRIGLDVDENRVVWLEKVLSELPTGSRILDAGAGEQRFKKLCGHLKYVAQDFGGYDGKGNSAGLQTGKWDQSNLDIVSDIADIPEPNGSFDAILCTEVLEHLPDPIAAIKEFSRLLKKGGWLIITAPFCSATHFAPYHFCSGFNRYFYEKHLSDGGYEITELKTNGNFFEYIAQETRRIPLMVKMYTGKKFYFWNYFLLVFFLVFLKKYSRRDEGSAEFLNLGFYVLAKKI